MKNIIILLLCAIICLISGEAPPENIDEKQPVILTYFSQYGMRKIVWNGGEDIPYVEVNVNEIRYFPLCLERTNFDQKFFVSPYYVDKNVNMDDAIILCLVGQDNYESIGIFNDYELFDALLFKRIESIPNSVINPIVNDDIINYQYETTNCYDFYGLPTKDVLGQLTCLLSVDMTRETKYIYSGPLMGNAMIKNFLNLSVYDVCYTTVNDSVTSLDNNNECKTIVSLNSVEFQCCCIKTPELCSPKSLAVKNENKLFCLNGHFSSNSIPLKDYSIPISNNGVVNLFCSTTISVRNTSETFEIFIHYEATDICDVETKYIINSNSGGEFCSSESHFPEEIEMIKCCNDGHFCNQKFIPPKLPSFKCFYKPSHAGYFLETEKCEVFIDIRAKRHVNILLHFNAKIPKDQRIYSGENKITSNGNYECSYAYFEIIRADSDSCETPMYTSKNVNEYRPFIHVKCVTNSSSSSFCDNTLPPFDRDISTCETLSKTLFDEGKLNPPTMKNVKGWICFVEISFNYSSNKYYIRAGEMTDFKAHKACLQNDMNNGTFCCSHVFNTPQNETECTLKKLIAKIRHRKNNPSKNENGNGYFSNCLTRDLPLDRCLSESGCFVTRLLEYSQHSDAIEPAGCIDNTEKNIIEDISMAFLSLGCRVDENSNRCSVIQTPEGHQRIVCCCNGKECESGFSKLPKQIGKNISSFKGSD